MKICSAPNCSFPALSGGEECWIHLSNQEKWIFNFANNLVQPPYNLQNIVLENFDFSGMDLSGSQLSGATFIHCNFRKTKFNGSTIKRTRLIKCNFSESDMSRSVWNGSVVDQCDFLGTFASNVSFKRVRVTETDLSNSIWDGALWSGAFFINLKAKNISANRLLADSCSGVECDFRNSSLKSICLGGSAWYNSDFSGSDMTYSNLVGAYFSETLLVGVKIEKSARITEATFMECDLSKTSFEASIIRGTRVFGEKSKGIMLGGAKLERTNLAE